MHIHVVKRGDTLSSIAAMHGALPAFVAADNGLTLSTPLVIGQALVVRTPKTLHTVRAGETLSSIARDYDLSVRTLLRRNFFLHGRELLREGDVLAIDYADEAPLGTLGVNAYAYPYIGGELLDSVLPYLTYLTPFTYGITPAGVLVPLDDARLLERAAHYGAKSLMHLSTLTPEGNFSSENAAALLQNDRAQSALLAEILQTMAKKGYYGLDVDFEYVPPELREDYAAFVCRLREALNAEGKPVVAALAPKTSAQQRGGARLRAAIKSRERRVPDDLRMGLCLQRAAGHRAAAAGARGARLRALGHGGGEHLPRRAAVRLRLAAALRKRPDAGRDVLVASGRRAGAAGGGGN